MEFDKRYSLKVLLCFKRKSVKHYSQAPQKAKGLCSFLQKQPVPLAVMGIAALVGPCPSRRYVRNVVCCLVLFGTVCVQELVLLPSDKKIIPVQTDKTPTNKPGWLWSFFCLPRPPQATPQCRLGATEARASPETPELWRDPGSPLAALPQGLLLAGQQRSSLINTKPA